ncbi:MAG: DNA mismatch repair endonuclease MutL [Clostridia bacterium]
MRQIRQLSSHMADLIAAGEVVERPMSVVKELLENSIDAKATEITIEIENGGITYIRIADNGIGMSRNDAPIAFLRHATSKIYQESDLLGIKTLGFRGEALAAISSVSKIDLFTKRAEDSNATFVSVIAGEVQSISEVGAADGTTIIVRDLFYNTPARMKFLKKDYTEASYIMNIVQNLALSNPNIAFKYIKDNKILLKTNGKGDLKSVIYAVLGKDATSEMIEVKSYEIDGISVSGFISKPHASKGTRAMQHFFVNSRYIKSRLILSALEESYKNSIMHGKFPYCVLNIEINEQKVDVNVHPTKMEIKFEQEKRIFDVIYMGCKNALDRQNIIVEAKNLKPIIRETKPIFVQEEIQYAPKPNVQVKLENIAEKIELPITTQQKVDEYVDFVEFPQDELSAFMPPISSSKNENTEITSKIIETSLIAQEINTEIEEIPQVYKKIEEKTEENRNSIANPVKIIGECFNTYILCEFKNEMIIIDKHAAHERRNFNNLMQSKNNIQSQVLLVPKVVNIAAGDYGNLLENLQEINALGFNVEEFSENSVVVREIPSILEKEDIEDVIHQIASDLKYNKSVKIDKIDDILHTIACKSAIKGNMYTSEIELEKLALEVLFDSDINYCPHGRPVKVSLTKNQLEKMFKRII